MSHGKFMNPKEKSAEAAARSVRAGVQHRAAFTLVELLVVLATVALLAAMVLPALAATKSNSKLFLCMNNLKQLALAWTMYADDNNDMLVGLNTYPLSPVNWRTQSSDVVVLPPPPTWTPLQLKIYKIQMGYKQPSPSFNGPLWRYAPNTDVLHCPGDPFCTLSGTAFRWDSYSGVNGLNGETKPYLTKRTQVIHPSGRFIWVEAAGGRGENVGSWLLVTNGSAAFGYSNAEFADSPAAFHTATANFNFCDGHVENHKWLDATTIAFAVSTNPNKGSGSSEKTAAQHLGNVDAIWVGSHYPVPQNP
jgi:prepilin-type processing-associated H-X9-DG protein